MPWRACPSSTAALVPYKSTDPSPRVPRRIHMSEKIEDTIKLVVEEGKKRGFLTYTDMSRIMDDQFIPPDRMDQVFMALEDANIDLVDDAVGALEGGRP